MVTWTWGGTMSGNWATGMRSMASAPAMVMMIAMTTARRGRLTKTAEIMGSGPFYRAMSGQAGAAQTRLWSKAGALRGHGGGRADGGGGDDGAGADALDAVDDDGFALFQA